MVLDQRKNYIIFNIVMVTNVFSSGGINCWNVFSVMSLCGSRLMDNQLALLVGRTIEIGSTTKGSVGAARSFLVLRFFLEGAAVEASGCFLFLALASAVLILFWSEAVDLAFGFELVMLVGKTMRGSSGLEGADWTVDFFFFAAILGRC